MFFRFFTKVAKWTIAFILIGFGLVLILQNINLISLEMSNIVWRSWPIILVIIGLLSFINHFSPYKSGGWKFGSFLMVYGGLLWADNFNVGGIEFELIDIWKLWPLILIYIGANILFGNKTMSVYVGGDVDYSGYGGKQVKKAKAQKGKYKYHLKKEKNLIGDFNFSDDNWKVKDMNLWSGIGDVDIDFSKAYIPNEETKIVLRGYIGDVHIKMPDDVSCRIYANVSIGDATIFNQHRSSFGNAITYESDDYEEATRKIDLHMDYKIGDITVDYV
ncbi:cell wall-active antibiotics response protein LiaF [Aquisalibacillus elongatus]|uniref:Lia operon protein LiaF n=1 Tax=Aquisalibacillus elongatus TaxID=485577 RepID=A0A3N5BXX9_9BACI|nr:cell wall-active antibiotics response protein LiaF [Aquisalibacillus elongatus]RPF52032.1 lia operon protein LiaF [Aquisalibacillus elongatus]